MNSLRSRIILLGIIVILLLGVFIAQVRTPKQASITTADVKHVTSGQAIELPIYIDTRGYTINAAEIYLKFDPERMQVKSISKENSLFKLWIDNQPTFSNETGTISFAGGLPSPGFIGKAQVGTVTIMITKPGKSSLTFDSKTRILLNDGQGSQVQLFNPPITINAK